MFKAVIWAESNMLDSGTWMAAQSEVERKHRLLVVQPDVLAKTIEDTFFG